jgi:UDP-3-O-[3-hydroxymyristoyl] glucosamine N-acyltransferase
LSIGDGVRIAAQSGVMRNVPPGATVGGSPAKDQRVWFRELATLAGLAKKKGDEE